MILGSRRRSSWPSQNAWVCMRNSYFNPRALARAVFFTAQGNFSSPRGRPRVCAANTRAVPRAGKITEGGEKNQGQCPRVERSFSHLVSRKRGFRWCGHPKDPFGRRPKGGNRWTTSLRPYGKLFIDFLYTILTAIITLVLTSFIIIARTKRYADCFPLFDCLPVPTNLKSRNIEIIRRAEKRVFLPGV